MRRFVYTMCVIAAATAIGATSAGAGSDAQVTVVASGLDHPGGIAFGKDGAMYVTEMGHGGDAC